MLPIRISPPKDPFRALVLKQTPMLSEGFICVMLPLLGYMIWEAALLARHTRYPGPQQYPIVGNIISGRKAWLKFAALGKTFGPVYSLRIFRTHMLVVNNAAAARELFDVKSHNYWSRPVPKVTELAGINSGAHFEIDPGRLRQSRKMIDVALSPRQLETYRPVVEKYTVLYLDKLLKTPENYVLHIRSVGAGVGSEITYGYKIHGAHDPILRLADNVFKAFAKAFRLGGHTIDCLPFLTKLSSFLPDMRFKRDAQQLYNKITELAERGFQLGQDAIASGLERPTLMSMAVNKPDQFPLDLILYNATQASAGASDNVESIISSFYLAMIKYPDVQRKAQAELDRVIGDGRLPRYADRANLPYTKALINEVVRCFPSIPLVARSPSKDAVHNGYYISENTIVVLNLWAMLHDETVWSDSEEFKPDRWLAADAADKPDPLEIAFGFNRLACPARSLSAQILFTIVACTLATFDISPERGSDEDSIIPSGEYADGGITYPPPFTCEINPRSQHAYDLIITAMAEL